MGIGSADESGRFSTSNGQFMNMKNGVIKEEWKGGVPVVPPSLMTTPVITNVKVENPLSPDHDMARKRKLGFLPLEVGTRVLCKWRDGKFHPVKITERRKLCNGATNDYEYYVHYTECTCDDTSASIGWSTI